MKKLILITVAFLSSILIMNAQNWSGSTPGNIYYNQGKVGIGTTTPQANADITTTSSTMLLPNNSGSTNTAILRVGYYSHSWAGVQLDMGIYNHSVSQESGYPAWIQARNPVDFSINRNLLLNPNGGNIGIGTKTPQASIDISTKSAAMLLPTNSGSTNTAIMRIGYHDYSWAGSQLDIGIYNNPASGYPTWIQARNPVDYSINRNLSLNPNGGNVGIGTTNPQSKLTVNGTITSKEVVVTIDGWSDFVFNKNYKLKNLEEVESFIKENNHLPDIPSESEVLENGIQVGEMNAKLLQKIEELTLYMIEQNKKTEILIEKVETLESENKLLRKEISTLKTQ